MNFLRAIHPRRRPPSGNFSVTKEAREDFVASDHAIVKKIVRLPSTWFLLLHKHHWKHEVLDMYFKLALGFTDLHVLWHPLRAVHGDCFVQILNKMCLIGNGIAEKQQKKQARYRAERARRLRSSFFILELRLGQSSTLLMLSV